MTDLLNILHISDLHCDRSSSDGGYAWSSDAARRYAERLQKTFIGQNVPKSGRADLILVTGDFVHMSCRSFGYAREFLDAFADVFTGADGIAPDVIVCPGNHDYVQKKEEQGNIIGARAGYTEFSSDLHQLVLERGDNLKIHEDFREKAAKEFQEFSGAELISPSDRWPGLAVLSLDSTWQYLKNSVESATLEGRLHKPKYWTSDASLRSLVFNNIAEAVADLGSELPTIILSHYPIDASSNLLSKHKHFEPKDHIAYEFRDLVKAIESKTEQPVLVFSGDVHEAETFRMDIPNNDIRNVIQYVTGRCYLKFGEPPRVPWEACARMVVAKKQNGRWYRNKSFRSIVLKVAGDAEGFNPNKAVWEPHACSERIPRTWMQVDERNNDKVDIKEEVSEGVANNDSQDSELEWLFKEQRIVELRRIRSEDSSKFDRLVSIRVGPIMNLPNVREYSIDILGESLRGKSSDTLLVGLDCWGYTLATRLGFAAKLPAVGVSVRGLNDEEFEFEFSRRSLMDRITPSDGSPVKCLCYITDVIATGQTLAKVARHFSDSKKYPIFNHECLCVVRSRFSHDCQGLKNIKINSVMDNFDMPIIHHDDLPATDVLPAQSFGLH